MVVAGTVHAALRASVGPQPQTQLHSPTQAIPDCNPCISGPLCSCPFCVPRSHPSLAPGQPLPPPCISRSHPDHIKHRPISFWGAFAFQESSGSTSSPKAAVVLTAPGVFRHHPLPTFQTALEGSCRPYYISAQPPLRPSPHCTSLVPSQWAPPPRPLRSAASLPSASRPLHLQAPPLQVPLKPRRPTLLSHPWARKVGSLRWLGPRSSGAVHGEVQGLQLQLLGPLAGGDGGDQHGV